MDLRGVPGADGRNQKRVPGSQDPSLHRVPFCIWQETTGAWINITFLPRRTAKQRLVFIRNSEKMREDKNVQQLNLSFGSCDHALL